MNGVAVESNPITINVVEPEIKIRSPQHSSEFTSQPICIAGQSTGFEQLELRINGMTIPVNVSDSGEWEYHIGQLPNGVLGIQVLGRDMSGKIRATDAIHISILLDEVLYRTNFTGDNREWQVVNGDWSVSSDGSTTTYTASGNGLTYTGDAEWGDYQIESSILIHTPSPTQGGGASGIVFRYQDSGKFYHYRLDHLMRVEGQYLKSAQLYKWVDGAAVKIAEVPYEYEYDEWYDMKVIVEG